MRALCETTWCIKFALKKGLTITSAVISVSFILKATQCLGALLENFCIASNFHLFLQFTIFPRMAQTLYFFSNPIIVSTDFAHTPALQNTASSDSLGLFILKFISSSTFCILQQFFGEYLIYFIGVFQLSQFSQLSRLHKKFYLNYYLNKIFPQFLRLFYGDLTHHANLF